MTLPDELHNPPQEESRTWHFMFSPTRSPAFFFIPSSLLSFMHKEKRVLQSRLAMTLFQTSWLGAKVHASSAYQPLTFPRELRSTLSVNLRGKMVVWESLNPCPPKNRNKAHQGFLVKACKSVSAARPAFWALRAGARGEREGSVARPPGSAHTALDLFLSTTASPLYRHEFSSKSQL